MSARYDPLAFSESITLYPVLRSLDACIEDLAGLDGVPGESCRELREKIAAQTFNLVVAGQFKRGKTSVVNALIGANLLPVGVVPLTSIVTLLSYGETPAVQVIFENDAREDTTAEKLWDYVTEKGNPRNAKNVREVRVSYPSPWLGGGVRLVDTPGIGSVYRHNSDVTYQFLPKADAVLFILSVDQPVSQAEYDFLKETAGYAGKIFVLLNKADLLSEQELQESVAFTRKVVTEAMGGAVNLFPVSARLALEGKLNSSEELVRKSRFPDFSGALSAFLAQDKANVLVGSVARNLLRLVSQARFNVDLEIKSLTTPLDQLKEKIRAFENKEKEVLRAKQDDDILMEGETRKLLRVVEEDLSAFGARLTPRIGAGIERQFDQHKRLASGKLHGVLEQYVITEVKAAFDGWRAAEDEKIATAFNALCARFATQINDTMDDLFRFSSELFAVPFDSVRAESLWNVQSEFYYKFWSEPVGLQILTSSLIHALPKLLSDRLILKKVKASAGEIVEMQLGRVRYDFAQRLDKSMREFKSVLQDKLEAMIESIDGAVKKGVSMERAGEGEVERRTRSLLSTARALEDIKARVLEVGQ